MATRIYLVPRTGTGAQGDPFRPKYITADPMTDPAPIAGPWSAMDYGQAPIFLVKAEVTPTEHAAITANADVLAVPADLDQTIGGALGTVQAKLESVDIPAAWVTAGMTYRTALRWVGRLFCLAQRLNGHAQLPLLSGETLDMTVSQLPVQRRTKLVEAAQTIGLDTSGITGAMTIRQALKTLVDQIQIPIHITG